MEEAVLIYSLELWVLTNLNSAINFYEPHIPYIPFWDRRRSGEMSTRAEREFRQINFHP